MKKVVIAVLAILMLAGFASAAITSTGVHETGHGPGGETVEGPVAQTEMEEPSGAHTTEEFDQVVRDAWYGTANQTCVNTQDLVAVLVYVNSTIGEHPTVGPATYQAAENLTLAMPG